VDKITQLELWAGLDLAQRRWAIRIIGILSLIFGFFLLLPAFFPIRDISAIRRFSPGLVFCVLGIGVIFLRRSAALVLALITMTMGLWVIVGGLLYLRFPDTILDFFYGAHYLLAPIVLVWARRGFKGW
jgi:hypothetical protein